MNIDKTWVEIDHGKVLNNFNQFRKRVGNRVKIAAVVKANAYGHGIENVVKILKNKADYFAVDSLMEALVVREISNKPVLILGCTPKLALSELVEAGFEQTIFSFEELRELQLVSEKLQIPARIHLEIETGTSRNGILFTELEKYLKFIKKHDNLKLVGVFTHYANIEDTTNHKYAEKQLKSYSQAIELIDKYGFEDYQKHTACSAAGILFKNTFFNMIRLGISLYGMWPSKETKISAENENIRIKLTPAISWKTRIAHLKEVPARTFIGYGCSEQVERKTKIAVIPVGYYEGFDRKFSHVGEVLVRGKRCRVLGRVCMNMTIIDVSSAKGVKIGDEVVLLGKQKSNELSAEMLAQKINTINYEITTRINPLIKRIII